MDELKTAIINAFLDYQLKLENARPLNNYESIKEAICLEIYITQNQIDITKIDHFVEKATLNLRIR